MIKILFVCHGNICRSPMAEYVFCRLVRERGLEAQFLADSAATSTEEIGNGVHPGTRRVLAREHIPCGGHRARQLTARDAQQYDLLIGMDDENLRNMRRLCPTAHDKMHLLLDYTPAPRNVADPWYTGDFDATYADVQAGCTALLQTLTAQNAAK